ncbi:MAG: hypothetical protein ACRETL_05240, partial [Gammaproteobacteria bacterium]
PQSAQEDLQEQQTLTGYTSSGLLSKETATGIIADKYNILDPQKEMKLIENQSNEEYNKKVNFKQAENAGGVSNKD